MKYINRLEGTVSTLKRIVTFGIKSNVLFSIVCKNLVKVMLKAYQPLLRNFFLYLQAKQIVLINTCLEFCLYVQYDMSAGVLHGWWRVDCYMSHDSLAKGHKIVMTAQEPVSAPVPVPCPLMLSRRFSVNLTHIGTSVSIPQKVRATSQYYSSLGQNYH